MDKTLRVGKVQNKSGRMPPGWGRNQLLVVARRSVLRPERKKGLLAAQRKRWAGCFDVLVEEVADIPLSPNGKRRFVVNELHAGRSTSESTSLPDHA